MNTLLRLYIIRGSVKVSTMKKGHNLIISFSYLYVFIKKINKIYILYIHKVTQTKLKRF